MPPIRVLEKQSAFYPLAQRTAFRRRDARQQSRLFAPENQWLRRAQAPTSFLEIVSDDLPVIHAQRSLRTENLGGKEDFARVWIFNFGSRWKTGDIDVTRIWR